jgi:hypothetical protein
LRCDECGTIEATVNPRLIVVPGARRLRGLDGRKRMVTGLFAVFALGLCRACHDTALACQRQP